MKFLIKYFLPSFAVTLIGAILVYYIIGFNKTAALAPGSLYPFLKFMYLNSGWIFSLAIIIAFLGASYYSFRKLNLVSASTESPFTISLIYFLKPILFFSILCSLFMLYLNFYLTPGMNHEIKILFKISSYEKQNREIPDQSFLDGLPKNERNMTYTELIHTIEQTEQKVESLSKPELQHHFQKTIRINYSEIIKRILLSFNCFVFSLVGIALSLLIRKHFVISIFILLGIYNIYFLILNFIIKAIVFFEYSYILLSIPPLLLLLPSICIIIIKNKKLVSTNAELVV